MLQQKAPSNRSRILDRKIVNRTWPQTKAAVLLIEYRRSEGKRANLKTGVTRRQSTPNSVKETFFTPWYAHVRNPKKENSYTQKKLKINLTQRNTTSIIRQKGESQNGCFKKNKGREIFRKKKHFLPPDTHTHVCIAVGKKCSFFGKFGVLCFLYKQKRKTMLGE